VAARTFPVRSSRWSLGLCLGIAEVVDLGGASFAAFSNTWRGKRALVLPWPPDYAKDYVVPMGKKTAPP
jgi:hypothetical protein